MNEETIARRRPVEYPRMHSVDHPRVENPFVHRLEFRAIDIIKITLMSVTIAPLRLLLSTLIILMVWPFAALGTRCTSAQDRAQPMKGWKLGYSRILRFFLRTVFFVCGFHWVKVRGQSTTSKEAPIVCVAPHSSMYDVLVALLNCDMGSGVSREANINIPIIGHILRFTQPVLVSREDHNSRQTTIEEIKCRSQARGHWPQVYIFPEGTCSNRSCLISFKLGAFIPGMPVQPLCIRYPNRMNTVTWTWDGPRAWKVMWLTLCQLRNHMEVEYLPVYCPSPAEIKDPILFANNVRELMAESLGLPVTDHTYDDCRLMMRAGSLNLPLEAGIVEFQKLHRKLGFSYEQMQQLLKKFHAIDRSGTGNVTLIEFAEYLRLPVSPALEEVFTLYDRDQSGTINFREYAIGLSLIANPANTEDTLQHAFQLFDKDNKGYITQEELEMILCSAFTMESEEVSDFFYHIDTNKDGKITYEDFKAYAEDKPEYARLFVTYHEIKSLSKSGLTEESQQNIIKVSPAKAINRSGNSIEEEESDEEERGEEERGEEEKGGGKDDAEMQEGKLKR